MTTELPRMDTPGFWDESSLRAYGESCFFAGMESAANICEGRAADYADGTCQPAIEALHCADAIRGVAELKAQPPRAESRKD